MSAYRLWAPAFFLEDGEGRGISRIDVSYDKPEEPEALFWIRSDFMNPLVFQQCVAQVAQGRIADENRTLQTQLSMTSSAIPNKYYSTFHSEARLSLEFRDQFGSLLPVILDGQQGSQFKYVLQDVESKIVQTTNSVSALDRGCACATSNYPFELAAVYRILDSNGKPISEAGIQGSTPGYRFFGIFQKHIGDETNTGLALVNVSDKEATVSITLHLPAFKKHKAKVVLAPGAQKASFIDEIVTELLGQDAEGSIEIVSDQIIVATTVRTIRGVVSASLPLGCSLTPNVK